jgi:hypothetical protein
MSANRGGENIKNVFNDTKNLEIIYRRKRNRFTPSCNASSYKNNDIKQKKSRAKDFSTRLSLFDIGTYAYLRQDNSLITSIFYCDSYSRTRKPYCNADWTVTPIG